LDVNFDDSDNTNKSIVFPSGISNRNETSLPRTLQSEGHLATSSGGMEVELESNCLVRTELITGDIETDDGSNFKVQEESIEDHTQLNDDARLLLNIHSLSSQTCSEYVERNRPSSFGLKRVSAPTFRDIDQSGQRVKLFVYSKEVGSACLRMNYLTSSEGKSDLVRTLHGHELSKFETPDQTLVVIYKVKINKSHSKERFPYCFDIGVEELPLTLGEMLWAGTYPWDLKMTSYSN